MPLTGPVPEGGTFFCPHCGAMYSVTRSRPLQERQQYRKMRGLQANHGRAGLSGFRSTSSFIGLKMPDRLRLQM